MSKINKEEEIELKKLAYGIIKATLEENGLDVNVYPVRYITYCKGIMFATKGSFKKKLEVCLSRRKILGTHTQIFDESIIIFIDKFSKMKNADQKIINLIFTSYHEVRHVIQEHFDEYNYDKFLKEMELVYRLDDSNSDYDKNHDEYSSEIGANLYAIGKTKNFLNQYAKDIYNRRYDYLDSLEEKYINDYLTYNSLKKVNDSLCVIQKTKNIDSVPVLKYFMNEDGTFKHIKEIINNKDFDKIDKRIVYSILSSNPYMIYILKEELENEEKEILLKALNYQETLITNQKERYEKLIEEENMQL